VATEKIGAEDMGMGKDATGAGKKKSKVRGTHRQELNEE